MTTSPLPPAPTKERTFALSKELFRYKPGLFAFNLFMWGMVHASPALLTLGLLGWHRENQTSQRLATIPGVGIITATAMAASISDPSLFRSGREFAAFLGLVPRQSSSGGKERLGRISKKGDGYLRKLLVMGATSVIRRARSGVTPSADWVQSLLLRRPSRVVTVAMANKTARIAWAVMARGENYRPTATA